MADTETIFACKECFSRGVISASRPIVLERHRDGTVAWQVWVCPTCGMETGFFISAAEGTLSL